MKLSRNDKVMFHGPTICLLTHSNTTFYTNFETNVTSLRWQAALQYMTDHWCYQHLEWKPKKGSEHIIDGCNLLAIKGSIECYLYKTISNTHKNRTICSFLLYCIFRAFIEAQAVLNLIQWSWSSDPLVPCSQVFWLHSIHHYIWIITAMFHEDCTS